MRIIMKGTSRVVLVCGDVAIKFPCFNVIKIIKNFLTRKQEGTLNARVEHYNKNKLLAVFAYIKYVIYSNRREYLYYLEHSNEENLLPVVKAFLWGWIIVQPKGEVLEENSIEWKMIKSNLESTGIYNEPDLFDCSNFCKFKSRTRILDYAHVKTQHILEDTNYGCFTPHSSCT